MKDSVRLPTIIIPYTGPSLDPKVQDIAIYLRPESNGVKVESTILQVIHKNPAYKKALRIAYLSNIPGDFIVRNKIIEEHYSLKIYFAKQGRQAFTDSMKAQFEHFFCCPFDQAEVLGSFEALNRPGMTEDELSRIWVPMDHFASICGQTVKKKGDTYIVNYDIPALLHKNSADTDIFSMILRSFLPYKEFHALINDINGALKAEGIITNPTLYYHVFHYSKGPFEQILDGMGYIYANGEKHIDISDLSFYTYLLSKGCSREDIMSSIHHPIMSFRTAEGVIAEKNLYDYTFEDSFDDAFKKFNSRAVA